MSNEARTVNMDVDDNPAQHQKGTSGGDEKKGKGQISGQVDDHSPGGQRYKAVQNMRRAAVTPRILGPIRHQYRYNPLNMLDQDSRLENCDVVINYKEKMVATTTFDSGTLQCNRCTNKHNALLRLTKTGEKEPTVIFLSDQD